MMVDCRKCGRRRSTQFMQEAVFRNFAGDEPAGVWQCGSSQSCRQARRTCKKCGHRLSNHEHTDRWFDGKPGTYCMKNMGMGDPCGCDEHNK